MIVTGRLTRVTARDLIHDPDGPAVLTSEVEIAGRGWTLTLAPVNAAQVTAYVGEICDAHFGDRGHTPSVRPAEVRTHG